MLNKSKSVRTTGRVLVFQPLKCICATTLTSTHIHSYTYTYNCIPTPTHLPGHHNTNKVFTCKAMKFQPSLSRCCLFISSLLFRILWEHKPASCFCVCVVCVRACACARGHALWRLLDSITLCLTCIGSKNVLVIPRYEWCGGVKLVPQQLEYEKLFWHLVLNKQ